MPTYTATATIDLAAVQHNLRRLQEFTDAKILTAVKADAYGHGLIPIARAALAGGAHWLGTAQLAEALAMREAGITAPILAWLYTPSTTAIGECIAADIDLSAPDVWAVELIAHEASRVGKTARIHLEVDTGMSRGGVRLPEFELVARAAKTAQDNGQVRVVGLWTHLARADEVGNPSITEQYQEYENALALAADLGLEVELRHVANSAATLTEVEHYDLVRPGLACYGLSPLEQSPLALGLRPAMRLTSELAVVKHVPAGTGISYGHTFVTDKPTTVGVVPLGYGDGIPRAASNRAAVHVMGQQVPVIGRVCMDQFMVDLGDLPVQAGEEVIVFGSGAGGEPTAHDWAEASGSIDYEIVTRLGSRVPRTYVGGPQAGEP